MLYGNDREAHTNLQAEDIEPIDNVTEDDLERIFDESRTAFGKFVILFASDDAFIQSACTWQPTDESKRFIEQTGSEPFCLEYRDPNSGKLFAAAGDFTLSQIRDAFIEYHNGRDTWKQGKVWEELIL